MLEHTRQSIHFGVGGVFTPQPVCDPPHALEFQRELAAHGLAFSTTNVQTAAIVLSRAAPPLEVRVQQPGPMVGSFAVVAQNPQRVLEDFVDEVRTVQAAFGKAWPGAIQLVQREVSMQYVYDVASGDAFKFLWEERLGRRQSELGMLGRPVLGGGLRFVMPPTETDEENANATVVQIESLFADRRKLWVNIQRQWMSPRPMDELHPELLLQEVDQYEKTEIVAFINGD
jgi:hypothetical protein